MAVVTARKKKRVSKKSKVSWRKHVDIQDVDNFLEEKRLEERLGEPLDVLSNDELFKIDTKPATESDLTAKQRKRLRVLAPPKCFAMLQPHTKVPDPITKRNRVRTKEERRCPILKQRDQLRRLNGILKPKELQSIKDRQLYEESRKNKPEKGQFNRDIWNADDDDLPIDSEWVEKLTERHTQRGLGKLRKIIPKPVRDKRMIETVEAPHPGMSYNPSFQDHQKLLNEIAEKEVKIIKEEEHLKRVTQDMFRKVTADQKQNAWLTEMSQGLPKPDDTENNAQSNGDNSTYKSVNPPVKNKKKSARQRRKLKEQLRLEEERKNAKMEKKKEAGVYKIRFINRAIEKREAKLQKLREKRLKVEKYKEKEPRRVSKLKYEEPDLEFNLGQDIPGSLKNVKKEGNLLTDRFRSMQKRNILEIGVRHNRKRGKVKKYVRPGFKDDWKSTVAWNCTVSK